MGIKLVEHVLDHAPATLTTGEWKGLVILAQDANDKTRLTYRSVNDPVILRRIGMSEPAWKNLRGALVRKGVLEVAVPGQRGRTAKYRIPVLGGMGHPVDAPTTEGMGHPTDDPFDPMRHPADAASPQWGIQHMPPTPPFSSPTSSSAPSDPPATSPTEGGGGSELDRAEQFLQDLPDAWACGRRTAKRLAPQLLERIQEKGWGLDADLVRELTKNPGGISRFEAVLPGRIDDLRKRPTGRTRDSPRPAVAGLPRWCESEDCNPHTRMRTDLDGPNGYPLSEPCKICHPDMIKDTAA